MYIYIYVYIYVYIYIYIYGNKSLTAFVAVVDTDSDRSSPLPLTVFTAVHGLLSASALRDAPRTPDSSADTRDLFADAQARGEPDIHRPDPAGP